MKRISMIAVMCIVSACAFSVAASSASARSDLLWELQGANFPVAFSGKAVSTVTLETVKKETIKCTETEAKGEIGSMGTVEPGTKFAHLFLLLILFKKCRTTFFTGGPCKAGAGSGSEEIHVLELLGHLGLIHSGSTTNIPGVLLLVPSEFTIECTVLGIKKKVVVTGEVIGEITNPEIGKAVSSYNFKFQQTSGVQKYKEFLISLEKGNLLTNQHETTTPEGGSAEESAQEGEAPVTLAGGATIKLVETEEV